MQIEKTPIKGKKRKIIAIFFVIALSSGNTVNIALAGSNNIKNTKKEKLLENKKIISSEKKVITNYSKKRELKREIKRRKKYHKTLLENYNNDFSNKNFELITKNAEFLSNLREQFENKTYLT